MDSLGASLAAIVGEWHVIARPSELLVYENDGLPGYHKRPRLMVSPGTRDEAVAVVRALAAAEAPFVARGAGTGLSAGSLADGIVMIGMQRMRRIIAIDRFESRLQRAFEGAGATDTINYEKTDVYSMLQGLTGGRGPDACIDAVGLEAHSDGVMYAVDRVKQATMMESDRPLALRQAIRCCRNGGVVSVIGVYGGFIDHFPMGAIVNRSLTLKSGQCHVHRYMRPLLERIERGEIDPSFVITHRMPLDAAAEGYDLFLNNRDECEKVVLKAA